jgi:hypothetical protein
MGRRKAQKTEPGSEERLVRRGRFVQRRERRHGVERSIDSIIEALRGTQWYLPILPSDCSVEADVNCFLPAGTLADTSQAPQPLADTSQAPQPLRKRPRGVAVMRGSVVDCSRDQTSSSSSAGVYTSCASSAGVYTPFQLASATASRSAHVTNVELHPELPADQISELMEVIRRISEVRDVPCGSAVWERDVEGYGNKTFLRVEFDDWKAHCDQLSDDWDRSWHAALTPVILNIVLMNKILPSEHVGAGGNSGFFHSNNGGLKYPFKYAYPSPLVRSHSGAGEQLDSISRVPSDVPLFHSLIEVRVRPMRKCMRGSKWLGWHVTLNEQIPCEVCLSAALFCIYSGPRTDRALRSSFYLMNEGTRR